MAKQFQIFKKKLTNNYIKKRKTPEFTGDLAKQKDHWDAFVAYKSSELGIHMVEKAKENTSKKVYHHTLGQGGYKLAKPKWEKIEQDFIDKGITPVAINWLEHSKNWYYAHGGSLNPETGECIYGQNIHQAAQRLQDAIQAVAQGTF